MSGALGRDDTQPVTVLRNKTISARGGKCNLIPHGDSTLARFLEDDFVAYSLIWYMVCATDGVKYRKIWDIFIQFESSAPKYSNLDYFNIDSSHGTPIGTNSVNLHYSIYRQSIGLSDFFPLWER